MTELLGHIAPEIVDDPAEEAFERWLAHIEAKDAPILEAAIRAGVNYLVTLNSRDFTPQVASLSSLSIVSPSEMIERLRAIVTAGLE